MDYRSQNNGLRTFFEHWGLVTIAVMALVFSLVLDFFTNLTGQPWICFFAASMFLLLSSAALIVYAKIPVYQSGRFLTFGVKSVPENLASYYRWGWRVFLSGVVLTLCLLLSRPL